MFYAEVTQFHRPHGEQTIELIPVMDNSLRPKYYKEIRKLELRFTVEILPTGNISLCLEDPEYGDYDIEIIPIESLNTYVEEMLRKFDSKKFEKWFKIMGGSE